MRTARATDEAGRSAAWLVTGRLVVAAARPRQWVKNLLVVAAPLAAGALGRDEVAGRTVVGVAAFTLLSAGVYLLNDCHDAAADRASALKRTRPVASGALGVRTATIAAVVLLAAGLATAAVLGRSFVLVAAGYLGLTACYTLWLRPVAVVDLAAIAGGFVLRAAAGGAAAHVRLSPWFLIVTSFSALFVVAGKRRAELLREEGDPAILRPTLAEYTAGYLGSVCTLAATVALSGYCVWAFSRPDPDLPWAKVSVIPFSLALLRYRLLLDTGRAEAPEDALFGDRALLAIALVWVVVFACRAFGVG